MASLKCLRWEPTYEELISFLEMKRLDPDFADPIIKLLNIYKYHPRELLGLDDGQPIDSLAYDSRNNVSEDILQVEPQLPQNLHMPSSYNNDVANSDFMEVETHLPPNQHISYLTKDTFQELESQLLPNQLVSPIIGDPVAKYIFELESQLLPKQYVSPLIGDHVAKAIIPQLESQLLQLPNFHGSSTIEDHLRNNSFSEMEEPQLLPNQMVSSNFEDYVAKRTFFELLPNHQLSSDIESNAAKSFPSEVRHLVAAQQDELVDFNGLDHNSFCTLQSPLYPIPGSFYSSSFDHDLVHWLNQNSFSALQSPMHQSPGCLYSSSFSYNPTNGLDLDYFSTLQLPSHPQPGSSDSSGFSNDSTNGINYNCFSTLQFPIHPLPEPSYSNSFSNDWTNGLKHNSVSALQTPIYPQPASSYFSDSGNDLNTLTPQFAAVQEDTLANSHWSVQDDFSSPETGHISPDFNSLKAVLGGYVGDDGSDSVIETFSASWPDEYVPMASGEYRF